MHLDIDIPDEEVEQKIRDFVRSKYFDAVKAESASYCNEQYIKSAVKDRWRAAADKIIEEELAKVEVLRKQVRDEILRKLKAQISAAMKTIAVAEDGIES